MNFNRTKLNIKQGHKEHCEIDLLDVEFPS